jgi:uncharacterized protein YndB with AHSA1/START domain
MPDPTPQHFQYSVTIDAAPSLVWHFLTDIPSILTWIAEPELQVEISTSWLVGTPIITKGTHNGVTFENRGIILRFEPNSILQYSHLSSLARLPEKPESYTVIEFQLRPDGDKTDLTVSLRNFPTKSTYQHLNFYWHGTINIIKQVVEAHALTAG